MNFLFFPSLICVLSLLLGQESFAVKTSSMQSGGVSSVSAEKFISYLPEKAITLDLILAIGKHSSDSYKLTQAPLAEKDFRLLLAQARYNTQLDFKASYLDDRNEATSTVSPTSVSNQAYSAKLSKAFKTGTTLQAEISHGDSEINFAAFPTSEFVESAASVELTQDLNKNRWGRSGWLRIQAGRTAAEVSQLEVAESSMDWMESFTELFYQAWLAQQRVFAAREAKKRKQRLYQITAIQVDRGTSEKPDLLQVNRAVDISENNLLDSTALVGELWRKLVINLKIHLQDIGWLGVDPMKIPTKLDSPQNLAMEVCLKNPLGQNFHEQTGRVRLDLKKKEAAELLKKEKADGQLSDLKLSLGFRSNGVDPSNRSETLGEAFSAENPRFAVGLLYSLKIGNDQAKAELQQAQAKLLLSQAQYDLTHSDFTLNWTNTCADLRRWVEREKLLQKTLKEQTQRLRLEEQRFQLGRAPLLNVIQAGDEMTETELEEKRVQVEMRRAAWRVHRLSGWSKKHLDQLVDPQIGEN